MKNIYLTTTLPYANDRPHIGHALEFVQADCVARAYKAKGYNVHFNTGTDEHGTKIYTKAQEQGIPTKEYVDTIVRVWKEFLEAMYITPTTFTRTTDTQAVEAAQHFWNRCLENGDIYKGVYKGYYCIGCELYIKEDELIEGACPHHSKKQIEFVEEENYYFKFSKYQKQLLDLYDTHSDFVVPSSRLKEIRNFVAGGLEDFSISRNKKRLPWGVSVPGDDTQVMYVWFDALVNYVSAIKWPTDMDMFNDWWPVIQYAGKDNLRQQTAMWQAMLLSAQLPCSRRIFIHGHITSKGKKMSKTLGNTIDPVDIIETYSADVLRYILLHHVSPYEDSDMTHDSIREWYNGYCANGIGNTVSRVMKLSSSHIDSIVVPKKDIPQKFLDCIIELECNKAVDMIWDEIHALDMYIQKEEPYKKIATNREEAQAVIRESVHRLYAISCMLELIMPKTAETIQHLITTNTFPQSLFPRV